MNQGLEIGGVDLFCARIADFSDKLSGFVDVKNIVDHGSAENFCPGFRSLNYKKFGLWIGLLRTAIRNFHLGPYKIEKSKIANLCHNKGLPKPFIKI